MNGRSVPYKENVLAVPLYKAIVIHHFYYNITFLHELKDRIHAGERAESIGCYHYQSYILPEGCQRMNSLSTDLMRTC